MMSKQKNSTLDTLLSQITHSSRYAAVIAASVFCGQSRAQLPEYVLTNNLMEGRTIINAGGSEAWDIDVTPDGTRLVIGSNGALQASCPNIAEGAIQIYDYDEATGKWLFNDAIKVCDYLGFGDKVAISDDGSTICVGNNIAGYQNNGRAWFYREIAGVWTLEYAPSDIDDIFGESIDLDSTGNLAVIVAPEQLGSYFEIHRRDANGIWNVEQHFPWIPFDELNYTSNCAIDGNWVAVSTAEGSAHDLVRMYEYTGSAWTYRQTITVPGAFTGSGDSGNDIAIDGDRMIIGMGGVCCVPAGSARIYEYNAGTGLWEMVFEDIGNAGESLGFDVDILGDRAIATRAGLSDSVYYKRVNGTWQSAGRLDHFDIPAQGTAAAVMDRGFVVGGRNTLSGYDGFAVREHAAPVELCSLNENFDGLTEIPPSLEAIPTSCTLEYVADGKLIMERPTGCNNNPNPIASAWGDVIVGDFDISFDWERFGEEPFFNGSFAIPIGFGVRGIDNQYELQIELDEIAHVFSLERKILSYDRIGGPGAGSSIQIGGTTAGSFRVERIGTAWSSYFKLPGDADWTLLRTATLSDSPMTFGFGQGGSIDGVGVRIDNLILTTGSACGGGCNAADLAEPFGVLDLVDIQVFTSGFLAQDPIADLNGDGVLDLLDIQQFIDSFLAGCP